MKNSDKYTTKPLTTPLHPCTPSPLSPNTPAPLHPCTPLKDKLYRYTAANRQFRVFAVDSTHSTQIARDLHDLSPLATLLMGRMLSAAALLSLDLKDKNSDLTLRVDSQNELKGGVVIAGSEGNLRGYLFAPHIFYEDPAQNLNLGPKLLPGTLSLMRNNPKKSPYTGMIELKSGEIAEDLAWYYQVSEQIPTAVNLGVLIDPEARVRASGGFIIQQLPFAEAAVAELFIDNLNACPNLSDLMDMGLSIPEILARFIFKELDFELTESRDIRYQCHCSKQRFADALRLLGKAELTEMLDGISPVCHYCNRTYEFSTADLQALISPGDHT